VDWRTFELLWSSGDFDPTPGEPTDPDQPPAGTLWQSYRVNPSFSTTLLTPVQLALRNAVVHAHVNRRTSQMSNLWTLPHDNIYNWRWPASYLNSLGNALYRSGDGALLDIADDLINFLLDKGLTRSWIKWPSNLALPTLPEWNGTPTTRTGGEEYESWNYYANKDEAWFARDQGNYLRILYKKLGGEDTPHWGTEGTHALDEQLGHGLLSFWMWVFERNRDRAGVGNKNWGATADRLYAYFNGPDGYWAKWANRPNMHVYLVSNGVVKDGGIRNKSRDSTTKIHNGTHKLAHPWFNLWRIYYFNNETRRQRGVPLSSDDTTASSIVLRRFIDDLGYATVPTGAATGLAIPIATPEQYQMMFWPHAINSTGDGAHSLTYPVYLVPCMTDAMNIGAQDSLQRSITRADMEKAANAVGFAWFRDRNTGSTQSYTVGGVYVSGVAPNYLHKLANDSATNPSTYTSPIKGSGLRNGSYSGATGSGAIQHDPTAEKYTIKCFRYAVETAGKIGDRFFLANILADHTHTSNTKWGPLLNFYNIALEQPTLDLANTAFPP
jgi:hypothetical protein